MAADGSLKFDTAINIDGFEEGISTLSKAMDRLTKAVDRLSTNILNHFNGAGQAMAETGQAAQSTSEAVDTIGESADQSAKQIKSLQEQMDAISVHAMQDNASDVAQTAPVSAPTSQESLNYDPNAMAAVFGEEAAQIQNYAEAVEQYGEQGAAALNQMDLEAQALKQQMDQLHIQDLEAVQTTPREAVAVPTSADSLNYDPGAMAAVFGEAASKIHNWAEAVAQYGIQASASMNGLQQEAANAERAVDAASDHGKEQTQGYVGVKESILNAFKNVPQAFGKIPAAAKTELSKVPGIVKNAFSSAARAVTSFGKILGRGLADKVKQAVSGLKGLGKSSNKVSQSILKLSNMFKLMLIRMAMRAAIQGVKEGMQNLVQYSDSANQSMSGLMTNMTYLKNSFAAAFAPILSVVAPVLNTLINLLATAVGYINQFFSALGGGSTYIRAQKANEDYAASLKKTGGAASKAGKDAKKALAPFDELVQIQQQGADSSGGGGGGASSSDMFETVGIDQGISDFANKLKELFAAGDWEGIGQLIGQKINESVQSFTQFISWDNIGAQITAFVTAFTTLFNSLVSNVDWYAIGIMFGTGINTLAATLFMLLTQIDWFMFGNALSQGLMGMVNTVDWELFGATLGAYFQAKISGLLGFVLGVDWGAIGAAIATGLMGLTGQIDWIQLGYLFAAGLNTVFSTLGEFAATFNWIEFGSQLASSLSTFFQSFDWAGAGTAISDIVIGLLNALVTFITQTDWWAFGEGVATSLENINWSEIANRLFAAIGAALGGIAAFLGGLISDGVAAAKKYFQGKIEECGGNVIDGIFKGIIDAVKGIGSWIMDNVFTPFIDGFKNAFGIHSPSTVMAGMGQYLWDGFCNGITEFFSNPVSFIKDKITDPFVNGVKSLLGIHSPSTVLEGLGSNTVAGFNQGVTKEQSASQSVVQSWATGVASWFANKFGIGNSDSTEAKKWATSILSGFNNTVGHQYTDSQSIMENWAENVRKWFVGSNESQGVNESSWAKFADMIIQSFKTKIERSYVETRGPLQAWAKNAKEWFWGDTNVGGTNGLYGAFYNMAKRINEGFANGISDFAYMAKNAIRKWAQEAMDEAEEEFDINSPSKEFHTIAEYVVRGFNEGINDMAKTSRNTVQSWLDGVMDVFDGVEVQLPIGISIPNAASYLPRMAGGTVVPPRAGIMSASMRNTVGYAQEEAMGYLIGKMDEMISRLQAEGNRPIQIVLNLTGNLAALARVLKPELDKEAARKGVSLVIVGG